MAVVDHAEVKLFGKWSCEDVAVSDMSLQDYIAVKERYAKFLPHSAGRCVMLLIIIAILSILYILIIHTHVSWEGSFSLVSLLEPALLEHPGLRISRPCSFHGQSLPSTLAQPSLLLGPNLT